MLTGKNSLENPILFIVSAPSGGGKTSLIEYLANSDNKFHLSVSCTTRSSRENEISGKSYHFLSYQEFVSKIEKNEFAEYAKVYDNYYGTPRDEIEYPISNKQDVVAEIDWQGARSLRKLYPFTVSVYILPPSRDELKKRLNLRAKDSEEIIEKRLAKFDQDIEKVNEYDFVLINYDFEKTAENLVTIFKASKYLRKQKIDYNKNNNLYLK